MEFRNLPGRLSLSILANKVCMSPVDRWGYSTILDVCTTASLNQVINLSA